MATEVMQSAPDVQPQTVRAFATLKSALMLVSLSFGVLNFGLPIFGKEIGASATEIGLLFSSFSLMMVLLRPLVGTGLDRYGRRWFFIGGLSVYGLSMLAFALAGSLAGLVIARLLQGSAAAMLWLAVSAIVADLAGADQRGRSFGMTTQAANQGAAIGGMVGFTWLTMQDPEESWMPLFFCYALACGVAAFIAWRRMPETRPVVVTQMETSLRDGLRTVLRSRSLLVLMLTGMVTGASSAMIAPIWLVFLQERLNADAQLLTLAIIPSVIVWSVLPARLGKLSDRFGRKPLLLLAMFIAALDSFIVPSLSSLVLLTILWTLEAICFTASDPAGQALVTDLTREEQRGRIFGIFAFSGSLGAIIGPLGGGWLYDSFSQAAPFYVNGVAITICAILLWVLLKEK